MAHRFTARAIDGVFATERGESFRETAGSFVIVKWPDGTARFGAPTRIDWLTGFHPLPDVLNLPYLCLSGRARALIESFEIGVHDFYPVRFTLADGAQEDRHFLHVKQHFDAVSAQHSTWTKKSGVLWEQPPERHKRLVFDARSIGRAHLWRNDGLRTEMQPIASDALAHAARDLGLTGLLLDRYDETDADGRYAAPPLSADRVYALSDAVRLRPSGSVPLTIKVKLLDGKPKAIRFADDPNAPPQSLMNAVTAGRRIDPADVPTLAYYYQNARGTAPDLYTHGHLPLTVSGRMKDLIEDFEPGVHQFLPLAFVDKQGGVTEQRFTFVCGTLLDGGSHERSSILWNKTWYNPGGEQGRVLIDRQTVAGRHVWRDRHLAWGAIFVSNDFAEAVERRGFPDPRFGGYELAD